MNFELTYIPKRTEKPRESGVTMMMDKGLSLREVENFIEASGHLTDVVKFGFGTSYVSQNLQEKINLYKQAGIRPYFGGTLFEVFHARGMFEDYLRTLDKYDLDLAFQKSLVVGQNIPKTHIKDQQDDYITGLLLMGLTSWVLEHISNII